MIATVSSNGSDPPTGLVDLGQRRAGQTKDGRSSLSDVSSPIRAQTQASLHPVGSRSRLSAAKHLARIRSSLVDSRD